jgi:hypothetical protein
VERSALQTWQTAGYRKPNTASSQLFSPDGADEFILPVGDRLGLEYYYKTWSPSHRLFLNVADKLSVGALIPKPYDSGPGIETVVVADHGVRHS